MALAWGTIDPMSACLSPSSPCLVKTPLIHCRAHPKSKVIWGTYFSSLQLTANIHFYLKDKVLSFLLFNHIYLHYFISDCRKKKKGEVRF
jgi:hypothetical protein